tara:strand:+ start:715 stop:2997 length:2283 start_codon:yes stop_codon:yes gene_type:complete
MATFEIENSETGEIIIIEGDSDTPPTESEIAEIVGRYTEQQDSATADNLIESSGTVDVVRDRSWADDPALASRMFLDGVTLGWGNEGLAAIYAAGQTSKGSDYQETYDAYFKELVDEENEYKDEFPAASLTLQILGGLGTGVVGAGRAAAKYGMKGMLAEGAVLSGVAGAGASDEGNRLEGTAQGALLGLGASGVLGGIGKGLGVMTKRRAAKDLQGKDGSFTPITLAEDAPAGLKSVYRDVIGTVFWAQSTILGQQRAVVNPLMDTLDRNSKQMVKKISESKELRAEEAKQIRGATSSKLQNINKLKVSREKTIKGSATAANKEQSSVVATGLNKMQDANEFGLRATIFRDSIPEGTPNAVRESIGKQLTSGKPEAYQAATKELQDAWKTYGYKMLEVLPNGKPRVFNLDVKKLGKETAEAIKANPKYVASIDRKAPIDPNLQGMLDEISALTSKGKITGQDISRIRAQARSSINSGTNNPNAEMANIVFETLEKNLTKTIKSQLDKPSLAAFAKTQKQYGTSRLLETTSLKAVQKNGAFTAKDWLDTISSDKFTKNKVTTGAAPYIKEATKVNRMAEKIQANTTKQLDSLADNKLYTMEQSIKSVRRKAQKQLEKTKKEAEEVSSVETPEIIALRKTVDDATAEVKSLQQAGAKQTGIFASLAGTGFLGGLVGSVTGLASGGATTASGILAARALVGKQGQRLMAGQTKGQEVIGRATQAAKPAVQRIGSIEAGLLAGEQIEDDEQYRQRTTNREFSQ